jgi:hypothetical protein
MAKKLKWGTIEYLNVLIDEYFAPSHDPIAPNIPTLSGLCLKLDISRECWNYYISEKLKVHRKSDAEIEAALNNKDTELDNEAFEELLEINSKCYIGEDDGSCMNIENDIIKSLVSDALKKAQLRYTSFIEHSIMTKQNPAGPIFLAKATLGYRENDPVEQTQIKAPSQITINILPQPTAPVQIIEAVPTTYSVLPDKATK